MAVSQASRAHDDASRSDGERTAVLAEETEAGDGVAPRARERRHLRAGARFSRYVVLEEIGTGAMGEVYSAYDPELDRRVAVKLLRRRSARGAKALIREAQAMAKLTHANVVAIHDVGTITEIEGEDRGPQLFIAMEYVEGGTLRQWWSAGPRSWSEIVAVFMQAGEGLAAAHAKKLVHRDFKPDNVLVGVDGRVKVTDFGLARSARELALAEQDRARARSADASRDPSQDPSQDPEDSNLEPEPIEEGIAAPAQTGTGKRPNAAIESTGPIELLPESRWYGSPAYMAPEQFRGGMVDHLTDQFGFCVSLFEALYGVRPFSGATPREIARHVCAGERIAPLEDVVVPKRVLDVVLRGLSIHRRDRFPNMVALLQALAEPKRHERRRWRAALVGAGLLAATAVGAWMGRPATNVDTCADADADVVATWSPQRRRNLDEVIIATEAPGAADTAARVQDRLDAYAEALGQALISNCRERDVGSELQELYQRRDRCLEQRLGALAAQLEVYSELEVTQIPHLVAAVSNLPPIDACNDLEALARTFREPPAAIANDVASFERRLDRVDAYRLSSAFDRARSTLDPVLVPVLALDYQPLIARAQLLNGLIRTAQNDHEGAEAAFYQSYLSALAANDDGAAVRAMAALTREVGTYLNRPEEGRRWAEQGRALAQRLGPHPALAELYNAQCVLAYRTGDLDTAVEMATAYVELRRELYGPNHLEVAKAQGNLAATLLSAHRYEEALAQHREALAVFEEEVGPNHIGTISTRLNLGLNLMNMGRNDEARAAYEQALRDLEARGQDNDVSLAALLHNGLGELDARAGDWTSAAEHFRFMHETFLQIYGPDNSYTANAATALGSTLARLGETEAGLRLLEGALAFGDDNELPLEERANTQAELAIVLWTRNQGGDRARARELFAAALEVFDGETVEVPPTVETWLGEHPAILESASEPAPRAVDP